MLRNSLVGGAVHVPLRGIGEIFTLRFQGWRSGIAYLQLCLHIDSTINVPGGDRAHFIAEAMKLDIDARIADG